MSTVGHNIKKRMSKVTTAKSTIESNISPEYVTEKRKLQRQLKGAEKVLKSLRRSDLAWLEVVAASAKFNDEIMTEASESGVVRSLASDMNKATQEMEKKMKKVSDVNDLDMKLRTHIKSFIAEATDVSKSFVDAETSHTEVKRYEKKVEKLTKKNKKPEKTARNVDKLASVRVVYHSKIEDMVERMKKTTEKYETVLQCAQYSLLMGQINKLKIVDENAGEVSKIEEVTAKLVAIDMSTNDIKPIEN